MYYYILISLSFGCFLLKNLNIKDKTSNLIGTSFILFSILFIISSTRYSVGSDYFSYKFIFDNNTQTEPLFSLIISFTQFLHGNYYVFVAIIFCLSFGVKLFVFNRLCYNKGFFFSLMLFCSFYYIAYEMNAIRQGISLSFAMLAAYYAYKEKTINYYIACVVAFLFHYTALIFIPFYVLLKIRLSKIITLLICLICIIFSLNNSFEIIIDWISQLLGNGIISYKIQAYSANENFDNNLLFSFGTVRRFFFFILILFSYEKLEV